MTFDPRGRLAIAEALVASVFPEDAPLSEAWMREVESRIEAYRAGRMPMFSEEEVFSEWDNL